ncbi:MAG: glucosaminidase domain-containing protein [Tannerellaceae bacterium]|nr:glucosaminidase domain-containing protein [Tannerellaceae bacterium]
MKKQRFLNQCLPLARAAGEAFHLNPVVILAQSALESGWGESVLAVHYNNFFGITAAGSKNDYWPGYSVKLSPTSLSFRAYTDPQQSFMDYARLLRIRYPAAADMSPYPEAFAKEIAYSSYISEANGDNREVYRTSILSLCRFIDTWIACRPAAG